MNATTDSTGQDQPPPQLPPGMPPPPLYLCRDSTFMNIARTIMPLVTVPVLVTNTLMLLVTWKAAKTRLNPFFFVSLAISDLLTGLFVLPIDLAYMFDPDISTGAAQPNASLCTLSGVFFHILQAVSLFSFFALSFDRFLSIAYPLEYILADKEKWNILSVAFIWMIPSTMYGVMVMAGYGKYEFKCWQGMCNIGQVDMNYLTFLMLTSFVVFMSTYAINGRIVYIKMYYGQNIIDMEQSVMDSTGQRPKIYSSIKAAKSIMAALFCYTLCWGPYYSALFLLVMFHVGYSPVSEFVLLWIAISNSFLNFFVFLLTYHSFRITFKKMVGLPTKSPVTSTVNTVNVSRQVTRRSSVVTPRNET